MANAETKKRPGIMLYFETIRNCTKRLDFEEKGRLFDAILAYGEDGNLPDFSEEEDLSLCIAWDVIRPQIDTIIYGIRKNAKWHKMRHVRGGAIKIYMRRHTNAYERIRPHSVLYV